LRRRLVTLRSSRKSFLHISVFQRQFALLGVHLRHLLIVSRVIPGVRLWGPERFVGRSENGRLARYSAIPPRRDLHDSLVYADQARAERVHDRGRRAADAPS
jgi:hypothetical protein